MKRNIFIRIIKKIDETIFKFIRQRGLGRTILLWFLTLSLVPLLVASVISFWTASDILRQDARQSLNSVSRLKKEYINSFFDERKKNLGMLSQLTPNVQGLKNIKNEFKASGQSLREFVDSFDYTFDIPIIEFGLDLTDFLDNYNYKDIFLIDMEGNVLLTIHYENIRGTNILSGKYSDTSFAEACRRALKTEKPQFSDIEHFGGTEKELTGFLIQIMVNKREKKQEGLMAIQIPMDQINQIMKEKTGDNITRETFLVGEDMKLRSQAKNATVLETVVKTKGTEDWLKTPQQTGQAKGSPTPSREKISNYVNFRDENVLGVHYNLESLETLGIKWGLFAEISETEAFASAQNLRLIVFFIVFATLAIVSVISIITARRIVEPVRKLSGWAKQVAIGDLSYEEITSEKNEIGEMNASFKEVVDSFQAVTDVCETIAVGDFTKTVALRSDKDSLGKAVNQMKDNLVDVVRQANNISMGDYSTNVIPRSEMDMLGIALERMTRTLQDAAMVAEEVSIGDYSLTMEIKGEKDMLGRALNQMIAKLKESNADSRRKIDYLNNIPTPVHVIDTDYTIQFINKAGANIVGKTVEDCIGKKCHTLFNTTHCRTERCRAFRAMSRDKVLTGDTAAHLHDEEIPMRYTSAPLKDNSGDIIGAIEYMVDISDEMRVVELAEMISRGDYSVNIEKRSDDDRLSNALNRMTQSLREAVEQNQKQNWLKTGQTELNNRMRGELNIQELSQNIISFITTYLDAQLGIFYFANKPGTLKPVGGYALGKEKKLSKSLKFGEGVVGQAAQENRVIEITDIPLDFIKIRAGFGDIRPKNVIAIPFAYEGHVMGVIEVASLNQITGIHREFLMQSLENIGIALNSAESRSKMKELLEKTQEQAERLQAQQEELRQSNEELEAQTKALIASETNLQSQQEELRVINEELEERTKALEKQKANIQQKNRELTIAQNEIQQKAKDLEEVSKYKSEFLANMSHELRTPLNSILILSQLLSNNPGKNLTNKQEEFARTIHSSGSDLLALINEILDLSKIEAGMVEIRLESVTLEEFTGNIKRVFNPVAANKGLQLIIDVSPENIPGYILTDVQRAQQIVKNLLSNAFKFTEKGNVTLGIYRPGIDVDLSQSGLSREKTIAFTVSDTGIGIPGEKQAAIFEAFRQEDGTTSRKYGGTGLGLFISRQLAELLGGEIQMQSEKGKGSTFTLYLPEKLETPGKKVPVERRWRREKQEEKKETRRVYIGREPVQKDEIRDDRKTIKAGDKSLLIIEDDPNFAEVLLNLAQAKGFKCVIAEDGETGLHFADFHKPSAIILDIVLPGIDGWEVMKRLKSNPDTRHIPVHFMSVSERTVDAMKMGAIGFLSKPVSAETLDTAFEKIESMLSQRVKKLLVAVSNDRHKKSITELLGSGDVATVTVSSGEEALNFLKKGNFDCMILNPELKDMTGFELLEKIENDKHIAQLPIIFYPGKELTPQEQETLKNYGQHIALKDAQSPERLLAETTLFLHRVESELPESKQQMLQRMINKEEVMKGKKILIVDDDMRNVFALTSILEEKGMKTVVGKNGKEGIERLYMEPDIDLALIDIMMPVMDGYEAMKIIRKDKRFEKLPIIALTAKAMKGDRSKCVAAGASDYLAKPVDSAKLLSLLRVWLYH